MNTLTFALPTYPHRGSFRHPERAGDVPCERLTQLAAQAPESLTAEELCLIFNEWEPLGSFEEMAAYIPRALHLLQSAQPDEWTGEIVRMLVAWCYLEEEPLRRDPLFWQGLQEAMHSLFTLWSSSLAWRACQDAPGGYVVLYADHLENLLSCGWQAREKTGHSIEWLKPKHYLARLGALGCTEHALLALWLSDPQESLLPSTLHIAGEKRLRAMAMVRDWLHTEASPEEIAIWAQTLRHHEEAT